MSLSFAQLWQQEAASDLDVIILAPATASESGQQRKQHARAARPAMLELAKFPAHSAMLCNSAVLWCRVLRWKDEQQPTTKATKKAKRSGSTSNDSAEQTTWARLELELQDASEQEAALAVLQSLYAVKPLPELLSGLSQEQQLQAAVLADKWQVDHVSSAAAQLLADAASTPGALAEVVKQRVLSAGALPDCLEPLLKSVLLPLLGDLEAAWADAELKEQLLGLSLPAMELLLSCDELKVASKDTVLYTLQRFLEKHSRQLHLQYARQVLAPLVRCQHLSQFWLVEAVASTQRSAALAELRPQVVKLLMLRSAQPGVEVQASHLRELLGGAPASWALGQRSSRPVLSVSVTWSPSISTVRELAERCVAEQKTQKLAAVVATAPLGGLTFSLSLSFEFTGAEAGCKVGVYVACNDPPADILRPPFKMQVVSAGIARATTSPVDKPVPGFGWPDFFALGAMAGGWDAVAAAAKGLPASGDLAITLTVSELAHMQRAPAPAPHGGRPIWLVD